MADKANKEVADEKAANKQETAVAEMTTEDTKTQESEVKENSKPKAEVSLKESNPEKFLADFNWHNYEEGIDPIDDGKLE